MANEKWLIDKKSAWKTAQRIYSDPVLLHAIKNTLDTTPTVDVVEVKHGRWLKLSPWNNHTQSCLCLNCDSISYQKKSGVYIGKIPNYCPNCGAKMDGDGNG